MELLLKSHLPPEKSGQLSPFVEAFRVLSQLTTAVCLMLIPAGLGYLLDQWLEITLFSLLGMAGGIYLGIQHLIRISEASPPNRSASTSTEPESPAERNK